VRCTQNLGASQQYLTKAGLSYVTVQAILFFGGKTMEMFNYAYSDWNTEEMTEKPKAGERTLHQHLYLVN